MSQLYDAEGNPVEALTTEEVEAKTAEAKEEGAAEVEEEYKAQLEEKEEELAKAQEKEQNFSKLRAKNKELTEEEEAAEEEAKITIEDLQAQIKEAENKGATMVAQTFRDDAVSDYAGDDEELKEAIIEQYGLINKPEGTKAEIRQKVKDAYTMAVGVEEGDLLDSKVSSPSGPGRSVGEDGGGDLSPELKDMGKKFGLSDEDFNKFGK